MALHYTNIAIASSGNSQGRTHNDAYRCNYTIRSQAGETYIAFKQKGATLRNLPVGTQLKIGWTFNTNQFGHQQKVIQWFKILSTPKTTTYHCRAGNLPIQAIDDEYAKILQVMGK